MSNNSGFSKAINTSSRFLRWWRAELLDLLPDALLESINPADTALTIELQKGSIFRLDVPAVVAEAPQPNANLVDYLSSLESLLSPVIVSVADEDVLCRELELPVAVLENLSEVLAFEMDRQTPFHADQVFYSYRLGAYSKDKKQIKIELCLVPKDKILPALTPLHNAHLQFDHADSVGGHLHISFFPRAYLQRKNPQSQNIAIGLSFVLLCAVLTLPFILQSAKLSQLQDKLTAVKKSTAEAQTISQNLNQHVSMLDVLSRHKNNLPPVIETVNQLSRLLPDTTWLKSLEIKNGVVHLHGLSASASSLIGILEASKPFQNAHFSSPVTQDETSHREKFRIMADLIGMGVFE